MTEITVGQILGALTVRWAPGNSDKKRMQTYIGKYSLAINNFPTVGSETTLISITTTIKKIKAKRQS